jgi:acyl carrier protein
MHSCCDDLARLAIGEHLDCDPQAISHDAQLHRDLGLDAFDLVLIVLRLDELSNAELAKADLGKLVTVGDLQELIDRWTQDDRPTWPSAMEEHTAHH